MTAVPSKLIRVKDHKIGSHKGRDRIWLEGEYLKKAGFEPSLKLKIEFKKDQLELSVDEKGTSTISRKVNKKNNRVKPVIDILSDAIKATIGEEAEIRTYQGLIIIRPSLPERKKRERESQNPNKNFVDINSGIGLLGEAAKQAGYTKKAIIEINEQYANMSEINSGNDGCTVFNQDIRNIDLEDIRNLGPIKLSWFI